MQYIDLTSSTDAPGAWSVRARGSLDLETAPELQRRLDDLIDEGAALIVLRLGEVEFLDSSGIRALVHGGRAIESAGGRLLVEGASGAVARVLELTDLLDRLSTTDEAV